MLVIKSQNGNTLTITIGRPPAGLLWTTSWEPLHYIY